MTYPNTADVANSTLLSSSSGYFPLDFELATEKIGSSTDGIENFNIELVDIASISSMWDSVMKIVEEKQKDAWEILSKL